MSENRRINREMKKLLAEHNLLVNFFISSTENDPVPSPVQENEPSDRLDIVTDIEIDRDDVNDRENGIQANNPVRLDVVVDENIELIQNDRNISSDEDNDIDNDEIEFYEELLSDSDLDNPDNDDHRSDFVKGLAKWIEKSTISRDNCNELLVFLNNNGHPDIPKTYATIMKTPREKIALRTVSPGQYYHYGIQHHFSYTNRYDFLQNLSQLDIDVGIDGLKLFKSSKICLWPIMAAFVDKPNERPFLIGCYCGKAGPACPDDFLREFVNEVEYLNSEGGVVVKHNPNRLPIKIRCFSADAPARAFLTGIKYHNAHHGCPKCDQIGEFSPKSITVGNPRTDQTFSNRDHIEHHNIMRTLLLEQMGVGMVSQFPLDIMHLVDIGVTRKMLQAFLAKIVANVKIDNISSFLLSIKSYIPSEFSRYCRSLDG